MQVNSHWLFSKKDYSTAQSVYVLPKQLSPELPIKKLRSIFSKPILLADSSYERRIRVFNLKFSCSKRFERNIAGKIRLTEQNFENEKRREEVLEKNRDNSNFQLVI